MLDNTHVQVLITVIAPIIPAALLFKALPRKGRRADGAEVAGPFKGLQIKFTGASAMYFAVFIALFMGYPQREPEAAAPTPSPAEVWEVMGRIAWAPANQNPPRVTITVQPPSQATDDRSFRVQLPLVRPPGGGDVTFPELAFEAAEPARDGTGRTNVWRADVLQLEQLIRDKGVEINREGRLIKLISPVRLQLAENVPTYRPASEAALKPLD